MPGYKDDLPPRVSVNWLKIPYKNEMSVILRIISFFRFSLRACFVKIDGRIDVIFATSTPLTIIIPALVWSWRARAPIVFEARDLWPETPIAMGVLRSKWAVFLGNTLARIAYSSSAKVVTLSDDMRNGIIKSYGCKDVVVITNGANVDDYDVCNDDILSTRSYYGISQDRILVSYCGTFGRVNKVEYIIRLAHSLRFDSRFVFLLVGDGAEFGAMENLVRELNLSGATLIIRREIPKRDIPKILAASDIAISTVAPIPGLEANSANKFFEGVAAGCFTLINYGGWQERVLTANRIGMRLSLDFQRAASQLVELAGTIGDIRSRRLVAREYARRVFDWSVLAKQLEAILLQAHFGESTLLESR
jgi:glycosyltransferase involved in cell wall biosynthesis